MTPSAKKISGSDLAHYAFALFLLVFFFWLGPSAALADSIDQAQTVNDSTLSWGFNSAGSRIGVCQSYDPNTDTTDLSRVSFQLALLDAPDADSDVQLHIGTGSCYGGVGWTALYAENVGTELEDVGASLETWDHDLTSPLTVASGTAYYITLLSNNYGQSPSEWLQIGYASTDEYPFGTKYTITNLGVVLQDASEDLWFKTWYENDPRCELLTANAAATASGDQTIYAEGRCEGFYPTSAWLAAVRTDPVGSHVAWSEGIGPFPDPYEFATSDVPSQILSNGTWRVRMYARDGDTLIVSPTYQDVMLDGSVYVPLTSYGTPAEYELDPDDPALSPDSTGNGYTFSASTVAIAAAGGLVIGVDGCAGIGEDATSTLCAFADSSNILYRTFPLLTWPMGIFQAALNAQQNMDAATPTYEIALPSHGDWVPAVVLVSSASSGAGIGRWIPLAQQQFFRSIMVFAVWVAFVLAMKRKADRLL